MDIWKILDWIATIGIVLLLGAIFFMPLPTLAKFGMPILLSLLALIAIILLHSAYAFVEEIPKRKQALEQETKEPSKKWKKIAEWSVYIILFFILWQAARGNIGEKQCPDLIRGNTESAITIQYFYSPFCPACWTGERILEQFMQKYPSVRYENYDARYCKEEMNDAGVRGSPAYAIKGNTTQVTYEKSAEQLERLLCTAGGCA